MKKIFVIGSINSDLVITAPYMPEQGETITGGGFFTAHGGKGANQATAAARLGGQVVMCGAVGDDAFGAEYIESMKKDGIDVSFVKKVKGVPTGTAVIVVTDGDNRIIVDRGANDSLCKSDVDGTLSKAESGDILLLQLEIPLETVEYAVNKANMIGMTVILNPAPANRDASVLMPLCDIVIPNETETEIFGGAAALEKRVRKTLIITLGSDGFKLCENGKTVHFNGHKVKAVDTTAAGDTFCGALAARLAAGENLDDAAEFANRAAAIACTKMGAQPSVPTYGEVVDYKF
ncbi:MAG: ribokinase [Clostridia bacterium]|nr:ribokinase [Clostridia bacterium]